MAVEGSVKVKIGIDSSGIKSGLFAAKKELSSFRQTIADSIPDNAFDNLQGAVRKTQAEIKNFRAEMAALSDSGVFNYRKLDKEQKAYYNALMANNKELTNSLKSVEAEKTKSLGFGDALSKIKTWQVAVAGAAVGITQLFNTIEGRYAHIDELSQKIGISKQAFQELDYVARRVGMSTESFQMGMKALTQAAARGDSAFAKIGVSINDANGKLKSQEDLLFESIEALAALPNGTDKAALSYKLFGRSAQELNLILNEGEKGMKALRQRANELGLVRPDEEINAWAKFGDVMFDVKETFLNLIGSALTPLAEVLTAVGEVLADLFKPSGDLTSVMSDLGDILKGLVEVVLPPLVAIFKNVLMPVIKAATKTVKFFVDGIVAIKDAVLSVFGVVKKESGDTVQSLENVNEKLGKIDEKIEKLKKQGKVGDGIWPWQKAAEDAPYYAQKFIDVLEKQKADLLAQKAELEKAMEAPSVSSGAAIEEQEPVDLWGLDQLKERAQTLRDTIAKLRMESQQGGVIDFNALKKNVDELGVVQEKIASVSEKGMWERVGEVFNNVQTWAEIGAQSFQMLTDSMTATFNQMGEDLVNGEQMWKSFAKNTAGLIASVIDMLGNAILANMIAGATANVATGGGVDFGKIAQGIMYKALLSTAAGVVRALAGKFEDGGIVPGNSFSGDRLRVGVNSGEMILNKSQQRELFDIANGKGGAGGGVNITIINQTDSQVSTSESTTGDGVKELTVMIRKVAMDAVFASNEGANKMASVYGVNRQGRRA